MSWGAVVWVSAVAIFAQWMFTAMTLDLVVRSRWKKARLFRSFAWPFTLALVLMTEFSDWLDKVDEE